MIDRSHWPRVRFDQMAVIVNDRVEPGDTDLEHYVGLEHLDSESLKIRRWGSPDDVGATKLRFRTGDIIFGRRRAYQRKLAVADFDGICSAHAMVLRAKPEVVLPEFLPFFMQSDLFMNRAVKISVGSLSPTINWKTLAAQEFALPPLEEQRRIAEVLTSSWLLLETASNAMDRLARLRTATIDDLCGYTDGQVVRLGDLCAMQNGRAFPAKDYQRQGVRLLRPGNLGANGYFDWDSDRTVCMPDSYQTAASDYTVSPGDVVINLTAQSLEDGFMGRVCIARDGDHCLLNQRIGRFVFERKSVLPEFVFRVLQTSTFQQHAISMCEGTKVKHMYWRHLERFELRLPPLSRQQEIASVINRIDSAIEALLSRNTQNQHLHRELLDRVITSANDIY